MTNFKNFYIIYWPEIQQYIRIIDYFTGWFGFGHNGLGQNLINALLCPVK